MYLIDQIPFVLCAPAVTSVRVICKAFPFNIWIIICDATSLSPTSECSFMGLFPLSTDDSPLHCYFGVRNEEK